LTTPQKYLPLKYPQEGFKVNLQKLSAITTTQKPCPTSTGNSTQDRPWCFNNTRNL